MTGGNKNNNKKFKAAKHNNNQKALIASDYQKVSNEGEMEKYNGGNVLVFQKFIKQIQALASGKNVLHLINPLPIVAGAVPITSANCTETVFADPIPTLADHVTIPLQTMRTAVNAYYDPIITNLQANVATAPQALVMNHQRWEKHYAIDSKESEYKARFNSTLNDWEKKVKDSNTDVNTMFDIYNKLMGPVPLARVQDCIIQRAPRKTFLLLREVYHSNHGDSLNKTIIDGKVRELTWNREGPLMTFHDDLQNLVMYRDPPMSDEDIMSFICLHLDRLDEAGLLTKRYSSLKDRLLHHNLTHQQSMEQIQATDSTVLIDKARLGEFPAQNHAVNNLNVNQSGKNKFKGKNNKSQNSTSGGCATCGKTNHSTSECLSKVPCTYCNKTGHLAQHCRIRMAAEQANAKQGHNAPSATAQFNATVNATNQNSVYFKSLLFQQQNETKVLNDNSLSIGMITKQSSIKNLQTSTVQHRITSVNLLLSVTMLANEIKREINLRVAMDSGATGHMFPCKELFLTLRSTRGNVSLGDKTKQIEIIGVGNTRLNCIDNALYVPQLRFGIISIPQLDLGGCKTNIENGIMEVRNKYGSVILTGTLVDNLYFLDDKYLQVLNSNSSTVLTTVAKLTKRKRQYLNKIEASKKLVVEELPKPSYQEMLLPPDSKEMEIGGKEENILPNSENSVKDVGKAKSSSQAPSNSVDIEVRGSNPNRLASTTTGMTPLQILHRRWGHINERAIKQALKYNSVRGAQFKYEQIRGAKLPVCFDCQTGRMQLTIPHNPMPGVYKTLEKVGIDYKGQFPVVVYGGKTGFYLLCDHESRYGAVYLTKNKSMKTLLSILDDFNKRVVKFYGHTWKYLQADSERTQSLQFPKDWLRDQGILIQLSAPYSHFQNTLPERYMGTIMNLSRINMNVYKTPPMFWGFAIEYSVHVENRTLHNDELQTPMRDRVNINMKTPEEKVVGIKPDISNFVPFYAPGIFLLTKEERKNSFSPKGEKCRMLGYSTTSKNTYIIWVPTRHRVLERMSVVFDEHPPNDPVLFPSTTESEEELFQKLLDFFKDSENSDENETAGDETENLEEENETENPEKLNLTEYYLDEELPHTPYIESDDLFDESEDDYNFSGLTDDEKWSIDMKLLLAENKLALPPNPKTVAEALAKPDAREWFEEIMKELDQIEKRPTYAAAESQYGRAHKTKLVLKYMYRNDYTLKRKARWVVCGYSQIPGVDYKDTYAPTTSSYIVFLLMLIAASRKIKLATFDITGAFLEGKQDIEQHARFPKEITPPGQQPIRVKILNNWYGTAQGPIIWHNHFAKILIEKLEMERCKVMPTLFTKFWYDNNGTIVDYLFVTIHVDDGEMVAQGGEHIYRWFIEEIMKYIKRADLFLEFQRYLGMDVKQSTDNNYIHVSHETYITNKFDEFQKPCKTPMKNTINLRTAEPNPNNSSLLPITGALRFPADRARPDILAAVGEISCGGAKNPSDLHKETAERICNYLTTTKSYCLSLGGDPNFMKFAYVDASYNQEGNSQSRIAGALFYNLTSGAVLAISRNTLYHKVEMDDGDIEHENSTLASSTCESEINAIVLIAQEIEFQREIDKSLKLNCADQPVKILVDSKSAILVCRTLKSTNKLKHINNRINYIRELINARVIELHFIVSEFNVADVLTKALATVPHERHVEILLHGHNGISPFNASVQTLEQVNLMIIEMDYQASLLQHSASN